VGVVRLVTQADFGQVGGLGSLRSSPYLARWSPRVGRNCTAKSRIDCAILARITTWQVNSALHFRGGTVQLPVRFLTKYRYHVTLPTPENEALNGSIYRPSSAPGVNLDAYRLYEEPSYA
jgi:hypothetical protein